jgi:hypothetical protein
MRAPGDELVGEDAPYHHQRHRADGLDHDRAGTCGARRVPRGRLRETWVRCRNRWGSHELRRSSPSRPRLEAPRPVLTVPVALGFRVMWVVVPASWAGCRHRQALSCCAGSLSSPPLAATRISRFILATNLFGYAVVYGDGSNSTSAPDEFDDLCNSSTPPAGVSVGTSKDSAAMAVVPGPTKVSNVSVHTAAAGSAT